MGSAVLLSESKDAWRVEMHWDLLVIKGAQTKSIPNTEGEDTRVPRGHTQLLLYSILQSAHFASFLKAPQTADSSRMGPHPTLVGLSL